MKGIKYTEKEGDGGGVSIAVSVRLMFFSGTWGGVETYPPPPCPL